MRKSSGSVGTGGGPRPGETSGVVGPRHGRRSLPLSRSTRSSGSGCGAGVGGRGHSVTSTDVVEVWTFPNSDFGVPVSRRTRSGGPRSPWSRRDVCPSTEGTVPESVSGSRLQGKLRVLSTLDAPRTPPLFGRIHLWLGYRALLPSVTWASTSNRDRPVGHRRAGPPRRLVGRTRPTPGRQDRVGPS